MLNTRRLFVNLRDNYIEYCSTRDCSECPLSKDNICQTYIDLMNKIYDL